jgi:1-acyl-sn-glycerol-3-phosphate acyltransferase
VASLYDAVAAGMWAYSNAAFRIETLAAEPVELEPGTLIVATHRRETDVPVLAPQLYYRAGLWRKHSPRMSFAARDDMFLPGFFAGFPPALGPRARRALYPVGVGRWLPRVQVHPIRSARVARLVEVLEARRADPLDDLVETSIADRLRGRAAARRLQRPCFARDVLRAEYADLLWSPVSPDDVGSTLSDFWSRRAARASADFRALVELLSAGGILVVFPEGRPSSNGDIGPLRRGIAALVRRGKPRRVQPVALAYDPLVRGRTRVFLSIPRAVAAPTVDVDGALLALLRRSMPLTAGQVAASCLAGSRRVGLADLARALDRAIDEARSEQRTVEPALLNRDERRRRVVDALTVGLARPHVLNYLARELASARGR